jgi:hypothetical protein
LFSPQRLQLDLQQSADGAVPWCCVVSDNAKVSLGLKPFKIQLQQIFAYSILSNRKMQFDS